MAYFHRSLKSANFNSDIGQIRALSGEHIATVPQVFLGQDVHVMSYPIAQGSALNAIVYSTHLEAAEKEQLTDWTQVTAVDDGTLLNQTGDWCEQARVLATALCPPKRWALHEVMTLSTWIGERTLLIGDAAHGMTPHVGAGAATGLEDAAVLANLIRDSRLDLSKSTASSNMLSAFEAVRKTRGETVAAVSKEIGEIYQGRTSLPGTLVQHLKTVRRFST